MFLFFFNDTATTEIYTYCHTLSLHDALPIFHFREAVIVLGLVVEAQGGALGALRRRQESHLRRAVGDQLQRPFGQRLAVLHDGQPVAGAEAVLQAVGLMGRSEERRVGKECFSTCRSRWAP